MRNLIVIIGLVLCINNSFGQTAQEVHNRGVRKADSGQDHGAILDYNQALRIDPNYAFAYYNRGNSKARLGDYQGALADFSKTIELMPGVTIGYLGRGTLKVHTGDYSGAIVDFSKAIQIAPINYDGFMKRGHAKSLNGDLGGAISDYSVAIYLDPNNEELFAHRAIVYSEDGNHLAAIEDFTSALKLNPNYGDVYALRGSAYQKIGERAKACSDFRAALNLGINEAYALILQYCQGSGVVLNLAPSDQPQMKKSELVKIYQNKYISNPEVSFQMDRNHLLFVKKQVGDRASDYVDSYYMIVLLRTGRDWREVLNKKINLAYRASLDNFDFVNLSSGLYLYYEAYYGGGNIGNYDLEFTLFDILSEETFLIRYSHLPEGSIILTDLKKSENLFRNSVITIYLEGKVNESDMVYKPTEKEQLVRKFLVLNERVIAEMSKPYSLNKAFKFIPVTTKDNLFDVTASLGTQQSVATYTKNNEFFIVSYFKGSVIGYMYSSKKFFCVWSPNVSYDWIEKVEFDLSGNILLFEQSEGEKPPKYRINPRTSTYTRLY